jgi:hypothetical protein
MAQNFSLRYPLVDGHGNFGSRDGDGAAAMRYTEARLTPISRLLLDEIDMGTVDFQPNYDGSTEEPKLLPARLPFVLLNGASGIAVGLATEIPSHNLNEIAQAAVALIKNPKLSHEELMTLVPGPDFPGIARLLRTQDLPSALHVCFTGAGGNVAAGKYNDGSPANRVTFALRLAAGMRAGYDEAVADRHAITAADVGWASEPVVLEVRKELEQASLAAAIKANADRGTMNDADALAYLTRVESGRPIDVTCLRLGDVRMLHMPGELFVEYQLAAQEMRPDLQVMMAAYGDYGPGYIGTAAAYAQGGYEVEVRSSSVGPQAEEALTAAMQTLLEVQP